MPCSSSQISRLWKTLFQAQEFWAIPKWLGSFGLLWTLFTSQEEHCRKTGFWDVIPTHRPQSAWTALVSLNVPDTLTTPENHRTYRRTAWLAGGMPKALKYYYLQWYVYQTQIKSKEIWKSQFALDSHLSLTGAGPATHPALCTFKLL